MLILILLYYEEPKTIWINISSSKPIEISGNLMFTAQIRAIRWSCFWETTPRVTLLHVEESKRILPHFFLSPSPNFPSNSSSWPLEQPGTATSVSLSTTQVTSTKSGWGFLPARTHAHRHTDTHTGQSKQSHPQSPRPHPLLIYCYLAWLEAITGEDETPTLGSDFRTIGAWPAVWWAGSSNLATVTPRPRHRPALYWWQCATPL